jgi:glycosyl-4,4'-diaponeurosporenoate acyltransferase
VSEKSEKISVSNPEAEELEKSLLWYTNVIINSLDIWFRPKSFESEELYEKLGIKLYKKYLPTGDLSLKLAKKFLKKETFFIQNSSKEALEQYVLITKLYELIHVSAWPVVIILTIFNLVEGYVELAAFGGAINVYINVYSVFLQRYNRLRLYKTIDRAKSRRLRKEE